MKKISNICAKTTLFSVMFAALSVSAQNNDSKTIELNKQHATSNSSFVTGEFGSMTHKTAVQSLKRALAGKASYGFTGKENFKVKQQWVDSLGQTHTRFTQTIDGIKVYGSSMIIHGRLSVKAKNISDPSAEIYAISGNLAVDSTPNMSLSMINSNDNGNQAMSMAGSIGKVVSKPELAYIYLPETEKAKLSWKVEVEYNSVAGFEHDIIFFDVSTTEELTRHPQVHRAKSYKTYNMKNNDLQSSFAPGTLVCSNSNSCSDASAQRAHTGASKVYDYYKTKHNRDSVNNAGMTMSSSVHTNSNWNNAVWFQNKMFYGDGDGQLFTDFTKSFDVIAHELTHGVTQFTANLVYQSESGALNEAMSDIMGVSAKAYRDGRSTPVWKVGEEVYTPGTPGDALRYMNNPTQDGSSKDYYPERYTGSQDNGGVHWNSGIANLAYVLAVQGGKHPRNKTSVQVSGLGLAKVEKIFYRALTTYFNQNTNFSSARSGTAQAAQDLYGSSAKTAIETAWCAVGVGSCPSSGGGLAPIDATVNNISVSKGSWKHYSLDIASGYSSMTVTMSGGTGDADLYVKHGSQSTSSNYDCRPYKSGNNETCTFSSPASGKWHFDINGYSTASGVTLNVKVNP